MKGLYLIANWAFRFELALSDNNIIMKANEICVDVGQRQIDLRHIIFDAFSD